MNRRDFFKRTAGAAVAATVVPALSEHTSAAELPADDGRYDVTSFTTDGFTLEGRNPATRAIETIEVTGVGFEPKTVIVWPT